MPRWGSLPPPIRTGEFLHLLATLLASMPAPMAFEIAYLKAAQSASL